MDPPAAAAASSEHLCYVRCNYCNTVLAVGVPCKRLMETVTVKCGHCNNLSFLSTRPVLQNQIPEFQMSLGLQAPSCHDFMKSNAASPSSSSASGPEMAPKAPFVVKPPERKHRVPSAYNRFMKEEIQRIKAAKADIPHREAFSMAAKNWAKCDPHVPHGSATNNQKILKVTATHQHEKTNNFMAEGYEGNKQLEGKN